MVKLTWEQALAWRMGRHHLVERAPRRSLVGVVERICGLHAQVMSSAELTAWARVENLAPDAVSKALWKQRSLVKLWAMRGTLHLLPARELGLWLGATATYEHYLKPTWLRAFETTEKELEALIAAIETSLDGRLFTREELGEEIERVTRSKGVKEKVQGSWGPFLKPASFRGKLCFGPSEGQRVRFTSPESWLKRPLEIVPPAEAVAEITRRYLGAFAPAAREDLARWWGVAPAQGGRMLAALGDEAVRVDVEGTEGWMLAAHAKEVQAAAPVRLARLLPGFDMWMIGASRGAAALLDPGAAQARLPKPGLDLPRAARERAHGGSLEARAKGQAAADRDRAVRQEDAPLGTHAARGGGGAARAVSGRRSFRQLELDDRFRIRVPPGAPETRSRSGPVSS